MYFLEGMAQVFEQCSSGEINTIELDDTLGKLGNKSLTAPLAILSGLVEYRKTYKKVTGTLEEKKVIIFLPNLSWKRAFCWEGVYVVNTIGSFNVVFATKLDDCRGFPIDFALFYTCEPCIDIPEPVIKVVVNRNST